MAGCLLIITTIPERYDIPDGLGIIQVLVAPQVRSVLRNYGVGRVVMSPDNALKPSFAILSQH